MTCCRLINNLVDAHSYACQGCQGWTAKALLNRMHSMSWKYNAEGHLDPEVLCQVQNTQYNYQENGFARGCGITVVAVKLMWQYIPYPVHFIVWGPVWWQSPPLTVAYKQLKSYYFIYYYYVILFLNQYCILQMKEHPILKPKQDT